MPYVSTEVRCHGYASYDGAQNGMVAHWVPHMTAMNFTPLNRCKKDYLETQIVWKIWISLVVTQLSRLPQNVHCVPTACNGANYFDLLGNPGFSLILIPYWYDSFVRVGVEVIETVVGFSLSYNLICT